MKHINTKYTSTEARAELRKKFDNGHPCRHLVLDDFFDQAAADQMFANFPPLESLNVKRKSLNENKSEDYHFERWDPVFGEVRDTVQSEEFAKYMSEITGIEGLKTTPDSLGSGVHQGGQGSYVDVHIDVNYNPETNLWRRINLLVYLNKEWKEEYGGHLELWDKEMKNCEQRVAPKHNRAVIFYTDENSPHGYSKIDIPEGESRKSFYTYFYTEVGEGFRYSDSRFVSRPDDNFVRKTATSIKEAIKINAKRVLKLLGVKSLDFQDKNKY
ncbi:MAG: 2OG-Fe(II) oxygenase [Flavobacteriia bacterium]|nr:2OG-Fe(II) oxygenase [Flavobacteriia bacterium]